MRPTDNAVMTALRFWQDAREEGTEDAWDICRIQLDAVAYSLMDEHANAADREYFLELRNAVQDVIVGLLEQRTGFQRWLRSHYHIVEEVMAENRHKVVANAEDDTEQGIQINKALYARFLEWLATPPKRREPDTNRQAEARAINAENRRAIG